MLVFAYDPGGKQAAKGLNRLTFFGASKQVRAEHADVCQESHPESAPRDCCSRVELVAPLSEKEAWPGHDI